MFLGISPPVLIAPPGPTEMFALSTTKDPRAKYSPLISLPKYGIRISAG